MMSGMLSPNISVVLLGEQTARLDRICNIHKRRNYPILGWEGAKFYVLQNIEPPKLLYL